MHFPKEIIDFHCPGRIYFGNSSICTALQKHPFFFIDTVCFEPRESLEGNKVVHLESKGPVDIPTGQRGVCFCLVGAWSSR